MGVGGEARRWGAGVRARGGPGAAIACAPGARVWRGGGGARRRCGPVVAFSWFALWKVTAISATGA